MSNYYVYDSETDELVDVLEDFTEEEVSEYELKHEGIYIEDDEEDYNEEYDYEDDYYSDDDYDDDDYTEEYDF